MKGQKPIHLSYLHDVIQVILTKIERHQVHNTLSPCTKPWWDWILFQCEMGFWHLIILKKGHRRNSTSIERQYRLSANVRLFFISKHWVDQSELGSETLYQFEIALVQWWSQIVNQCMMRTQFICSLKEYAYNTNPCSKDASDRKFNLWVLEITFLNLWVEKTTSYLVQSEGI